MTPGRRSIQDSLEQLRQGFLRSLPLVADRIDAAIADLQHSGAGGDARAALEAELHRIHGTGGSLGFAELSERAARLEENVAAISGSPDEVVARYGQAISEFARWLRQMAETSGVKHESNTAAG